MKEWKRVNKGGGKVEVEICEQAASPFASSSLSLSLIFTTLSPVPALSLFFPSPKTHRKALETFKCCFPAMCDSSKTAALTVLQ